MRRRDLFAVTLVAASSVAAVASASETAEKKPEGQYVDLSPTALPVIEGGRLRNYVFVAIRVVLTPRADPVVLKAKEPYFRDALVRAAHRTPFTVADDLTRLDEAKLKASLMRDAAAIAGPGQIQAVEILNQTPRRRTGFDRRR
ncbi:hypothetical protein [Caulobacter sp. 17J65-9]|uniref:hypothetical protein n=1 Tax=Caulobacter sp. 17J65-9 TaxID=2709382 RepID=UPI0013CA885C|nr:hypothetical protein [Caulobacter sp. 17J65-9]NEX92080.1 hypothetical protein [Caulobacter sp. 17J65-9]